MDSSTQVKCMGIIEKLIARPIIQYFCGKFSVGGSGLDVYGIRNKLACDNYSTPDDFFNDITKYFALLRSNSINSYEKKAIDELSSFIDSKSKKVKNVGLDAWSLEWRQNLQHLNTLLQKNSYRHKVLPISVVDTNTQLSNQEIFNIKYKIENLLNENQKKVAVNLIKTLEDNVVVNGDDIVFDIKLLRPNTLFSLQAFLQKVSRKEDW